jgi:diguanylate cyclase (GGDEF)-like protein
LSIRFLLLFLFSFSFCATSKAIELSTVPSELFINEHLYILQDRSADLSFENAFVLYTQGSFAKNVDERVSFGFTHEVIWASVLINNSTDKEIEKVIYLDTAWLDRANFYFIRQNKVVDTGLIGDTLALNISKNRTRMGSQQHTFESGTTLVLMRFESKDPLLIPLYLSSEEAIENNHVISSYFYGFIYGAFFILLVYNIALSLSLKDARYVFYSLYLLSFLSLNIAYTGHGFKFIWPNNIFLQQWLMIVFLYCYIIFGIAFCFEFLKLKVFLPKVYRLRLWIYTGLISIATFLFIHADQLLAVKVGVALTSILVVIFMSLGLLALKNGHDMVKFFLPAVLTGAGGAAISAATTWGVIPYNTLLFHSIEVGMLIEMFILALALAFNLKEVDKARLTAEEDAQIDHLTELFNRRAFAAVVYPQWQLGVRHQQEFSMILLDIDWFKKINDVYGHAAGDAVLKSIAGAIKQKIRKSDVLARWGGEEFIIFLPNTNKLAAINLANVIRKIIEETTVGHDGRLLSVTASFGLADYNDQIKSLEDLIKLADVALYKAKNSGRNIVCEIEETPEGINTQSIL